MRFDGKVVVITGGASGIGAAAAARFHREGAAVMIADLNDAAAQALVETMGGDRVHYQHTDVSDWDQVRALMAAAVSRFGRLDVLFNNAGIGSFASTPDLPIEDWRRVIAIDLDSVFYGCKAAIPLMKQTGGGAIINTASASGLAGDYSFAAYNAAKGAVVNYTRALAIDHIGDGIRVNAICPGPVDTPIIAGINTMPGGIRALWDSTVPIGRFARAEEIASVAAFLASDDASYVVGAIVTVDGGLTAHTGQPNLPRLLADAAKAKDASR
jgi:meso-butanediol dehydrogenase/(S,S)-butanediol dehydrogenase/diacetyl reductase